MDSNSTHSNATAAGSQNTGPPAALAAITPTNHTGIVLIGTALALVFSVVSMLIRLYIRFQIRHEFSLDDTASIAAVVRSTEFPLGDKHPLPYPGVAPAIPSFLR